MTLNSILPWQEKQWQQVLQLRHQDRMPHALLFSGLSGVGKKQFAFSLADSLLCVTPKNNGGACGECKSCHLLIAKTHPDLLMVEPEEGGHIIKIDQIREIVESMSETAMLGGYRIVIIDPANAMNINAANALLKTLEEPAARVLLILISNQSARLPATIKSRCQEVLFGKPNQSVSASWLLSASNGKECNSELLLSLANGAPLKALQFLENDHLTLRKNLYQGLAELSRNKQDPLKLASQLYELDMLSIFGLLQNWLRDLLRFKLSEGASDLINFDYQDVFSQLTQKISLTDLVRFIDLVQQTHTRLLESLNLNKQLLLEQIFIGWMRYVSR